MAGFAKCAKGSMTITFTFFCQYTHGVACQLLGPHDTLPRVLITKHCVNLTEFYANVRQHVPRQTDTDMHAHNYAHTYTHLLTDGW